MEIELILSAGGAGRNDHQELEALGVTDTVLVVSV